MKNELEYLKVIKRKKKADKIAIAHSYRNPYYKTAAIFAAASVMTASFSLSITAYADQTGNNPSGVVIYSEPSKEISGDFECIVDNNRGMASIVKYNGKGSEVWIPEKINGLPVKLIGDHAFSGCSTIVKVHMPIRLKQYTALFSQTVQIWKQ